MKYCQENIPPPTKKMLMPPLNVVNFVNQHFDLGLTMKVIDVAYLIKINGVTKPPPNDSLATGADQPPWGPLGTLWFGAVLEISTNIRFLPVRMKENQLKMTKEQKKTDQK